MECRLCGADSAPFRIKDAVYGECPSCGYIQVDEALIPTPEAERARYLLHDNDPADPGYRGWMAGFIEAAVAPWAKPGGRVLDFGSGPEPLLSSLLAERGFQARAWDPFFAPETPWRDGQWDAIALHEVAEHLAHPRAVFGELAAMLVPGALLCVRTRFPPPERAAFASWWYRMDSTHVGFFPLRALDAMAAGNGWSRLWDNGLDSATYAKS